ARLLDPRSFPTRRSSDLRRSVGWRRSAAGPAPDWRGNGSGRHRRGRGGGAGCGGEAGAGAGAPHRRRLPDHGDARRMFTGIVRELGRLKRDPYPSGDGGMRLEIAHSAELGARLEVGASLAVAGACLTLIESAPELSVVELSSETLARTRLGRLCAGDPVNLEPALRAG